MKRLKKIVYLSGIYSIGNFLEKGVAFLFIPIYTTYLGTADYGVIGLMWVTVGLCNGLFYPAVYQGFIRYFHSVEMKNKQGLLLFNSVLILIVQALLFSIIFFWFSKIIASEILKNEDLINIVQVYCLILFFLPISEILFAFLRQREKAKTIVLISLAHSIFYAGIVLFGLIVFELGVMAMIYGLFIGLVFKVCFVLPIFWKESTHTVSLSVMSKPLRYGYQRILAGWSSLLIRSGDRYVMLIFLTISSVGLYNFGYQIASVLNILFVTPFLSSIQPIIFKQEDNPVGQKEFIKKASTYFYLLGMFFCLSLSLYCKEIIEMIATKNEFWGSWVVVPILCYSFILNGMGIFFDWGLVMTKNGFRISLNVIIGAVMNIGFNFLLIPVWGILGAAYATLISILFMNAIRIYYSAKFYGLHFDIGRLVHITFAGIGLYALSLYIGKFDSIVFEMGLKILIMLSFVLVIVFTGFFTSREKEVLEETWRNIGSIGLKETYLKVRTLN
jgi:O-antigen/teichoic acid export membrane protein